MDKERPVFYFENLDCLRALVATKVRLSNLSNGRDC
jgi:hypothetical protein